MTVTFIIDYKWQLLLPPWYMLWTKIHYHATTIECNVTWCKHSSKTDLLSIWSSAKYKNTYTHDGHHENRHDLQYSWFLWWLEGHWNTFWWSSILDVSVRELLRFIFNAGSVVFNYNLQYWKISIERLRHVKGF